MQAPFQSHIKILITTPAISTQVILGDAFKLRTYLESHSVSHGYGSIDLVAASAN
jgi:hypothetical protein